MRKQHKRGMYCTLAFARTGIVLSLCLHAGGYPQVFEVQDINIMYMYNMTEATV